MLKLASDGDEEDAPKGRRKPSLAWVDAMADGRETTLEAHLRSVQQGRVTTTLSSETMLFGGPHPFEIAETLTWLLEAKRALRPRDVFTGAAWKHAVGALCWDQLQQWDGKSYLFPKVDGPDAADLQAVIVDAGNWTLEHDGLHISYPDYSIAPRVATPQDAVLPWDQLKAVLAPGFVAP